MFFIRNFNSNKYIAAMLNARNRKTHFSLGRMGNIKVGPKNAANIQRELMPIRAAGVADLAAKPSEIVYEPI
jgi:hypothetical protein